MTDVDIGTASFLAVKVMLCSFDQIVWDKQCSRWVKLYSFKPDGKKKVHFDSEKITMIPTRHLVTKHGEYTVRFEPESYTWRIRDFIERLR